MRNLPCLYVSVNHLASFHVIQPKGCLLARQACTAFKTEDPWLCITSEPTSLKIGWLVWAEFLALMSVDYAWGFTGTWILCVICSVVSSDNSFLGLPSHWRCGLAVALHQHDSGLGILHARNHPRTFSLHEIFKCAHLKFTVYGRKQTDIHKTFTIAVTLVWGSLRLPPVTDYTQ